MLIGRFATILLIYSGGLEVARFVWTVSGVSL